jgi:ribonuclease BN (tRNA processing enzyme)
MEVTAGARGFRDLTVLGSGTGLVVPRYWSGFALDGEILLDVPPTAGIHLRRLGIRSEALTSAFVSHLHADHVFGLVFLALEFNIAHSRTTPLDVVAPAGTREHVERLFHLGYPGNEATAEPGFPLGMRFHELDGGLEGVVGDVAYQAIPLKHHLRFLDSFGYRLTRGNRTVSYSGDTAMIPALLELGRGADAFIVECTNQAGSDGDHLDLEAIRTLRGALPASTRILVTHYHDIHQGQLPSGASLVRDFEEIRL